MPAIVSKSFVVAENDIDVMNHVNNRVYLRWMEEAAMYASEQNGWPVSRYFEEGNGAWVAREHWVEYLRPVALGDTVTVYTWVQSLAGPASLRRYVMKNGSKICCVAATEWNYINLQTRRAQACPEELARCFEIIAQDDPRLGELGVARFVRFAPSEALL